MKSVRNGFKVFFTSALVTALTALPVNALAKNEYQNEHRVVQANSNVLHNKTRDNSDYYIPVGKVVPTLAQIVFYYPKGSVPATINVDRELQSALLPGEFTVFCVAPGTHAIESYFNDHPRYEGKQTPKHKLNAQGAETYFLQVNTGTHGGTAAIADRSAAEALLKTMTRQSRILNRASQVKACEYLNDNSEVRFSESVMFHFGKSDIKSITNASVSKLEKILDFIKKDNKFKEIQVLGYTDAIGNREYNNQLSQDRAETMREVLIRAGANANIISETRGMGIAQDAEECDSHISHSETTCNIKSRRVDVIIR
ncbi:OmpA family protein [Enterobacter bugandensis]|uniref:OmpA family protein n=1 Tax=Enterobacter bugandensis TaxID=881260 RepID=UPI0023AF21B2|nr:OmpA family protein [Enterobacter bugandensis]MDE7590817.1 OmpA family protein [Enterobacter bugandensis]